MATEAKKARAVFAAAQAFRHEMLFLSRDFQPAPRKVRSLILRRVEDGEMLADNLLRLVSLDALGTLVPIGHVTGGVKHIDRVIANSLDQQPEIAFAFEEISFELFTGGHSISRYAAKTP
jgi:hypothetical protein